MKAQPALCHIEEDEVGEMLFRDGVSVSDDEKVDLFAESGS